MSLLQDPVALAQALVRCASITPVDAGALDLLATVLEGLGLTVHRLTFEGDGGPPTPNLYARWGRSAPHFCFAGHTDVVPPGPQEAWRYPPFEGRIADGFLWGRGAVDMKGAIAAFVCALAAFLEASPPQGSISLMITGDEEATGINGTPKILEWLASKGETIDFCLVGEPTSCQHLGDTVKIGRRGSLNGVLTTHGTQGHVAFPHKADNPIPRLLQTLLALGHGPQESSSALFEPSRLEITSLDVGNPTVNLIPGHAQARFNIRFSDQQTPASLQSWLEETCARFAGSHTLETTLSGVAESMTPGPLTDLMEDAVKKTLGLKPALSTFGATSDARFIRHVAPVLELGLKGQTMHQVDERVALTDLPQLGRLYGQILSLYFGGFSSTRR